MKSFRFGVLLCALVACSAVAASARAARVDLSLNVFPNNLSSPNLGGTWQLVAKTDSPFGISAISAFVANISTSGLMVEPDIDADTFGGWPFGGVFSGHVNIIYALEHFITAPLVGVGTPLFSDGPDPFGNPAWNGATKIVKGLYPGPLPVFGTASPVKTGANVLASSAPNTAALGADVTTVVRVATPEPSTLVIAALPLVGLAARFRKRRA